MLYVHPYEFDPLPLRFDESVRGARARLFVAMQNAFRARPPRRLARLLRDFEFGPLASLA